MMMEDDLERITQTHIYRSKPQYPEKTYGHVNTSPIHRKPCQSRDTNPRHLNHHPPTRVLLTFHEVVIACKAKLVLYLLIDSQLWIMSSETSFNFHLQSILRATVDLPKGQGRTNHDLICARTLSSTAPGLIDRTGKQFITRSFCDIDL